MKLLIVDDSLPMRALVKSLVQDMANEIFECADGNEVLAAYSQHKPDWVLMDIEMQEMDGLTASRQLMGAFPDARIIIVTKYGDDEIRQDARAAGAIGYVLKEDLSVLKQLLTTPP
jgi:CheY-like chemotaxis protein